MKRGIALALGLATGLPPIAHAQVKDASYYCVAEFAGGLAYDEVLKKWDSAKFRPTGKFIVHFRYAGPSDDPNWAPYVDNYYVTITRSGRDESEDCVSNYTTGRSQKIQFLRNGGLGDMCETLHSRYKFNLTNKRFLEVFENGYVNGGPDKDSDTPSISGGTCTKVQ